MAIDRGQKATTLAIPAPVGGLNARDALAAMPPGDASTLVNLFPYADRVETRGGFDLLSTATTINIFREGFVQLMAWGSGAETDTLFAAYWVSSASTGQLRIFSVASNGTLTTSRDVVTIGSVNNVIGIGEWAQFGSASGITYLILALTTLAPGAAFAPQAYDGNTWSTLSITGVPVQTTGIHSHRNRLWFYNSPEPSAGAKGPLVAYYLPAGAVSGTVAELNLAPFATKGGRIVAMRTWTRDNGTGGSDDLAVFLTNRGQAIIYSGTDPSSASTWGLVGVFDVGVVASFGPADQASGTTTNTPFMVRDSYAIKYGADILFLAQAGVTSANKIMGAAESDYTISTKINPLITDASAAWVTLRESNARIPNWKSLFVPALKALFISVPTGVSTLSSSPTLEIITSDLYVMNIETGAWTKFTGINVRDMIAIGSIVYLTDGTNRLFKYTGTAASDNGTAITFECRQAYNYLGSPTNKLATLMQPMLRSTGNFSLTAEVDADFNNGSISSYTSYTVASAQNLQPWLSANKYGRAFAAHLKGQTSVGVVSWYATNYIAKPAGMI